MPTLVSVQCIVRWLISAAIVWLAAAPAFGTAPPPERDRSGARSVTETEGHAVRRALSPARPASLQSALGQVAFRRLFVPATRPADWPTGGRQYLPLESHEFQRLATAANQVASGSPVDNQPVLLEATYQATLIEGNVLRGTAHLRIAHQAPADAILALEPCSLALTRPRWDAPGDSAAILGQFAGKTFGLLVNRSGDFHVDWSQRGNRNADGDLVFPLRLPASSVQHLQLTLPMGWIPVTDRGVVTKTSTPEAEQPTWHIELGNQQNLVLQVVSESVTAAWRRQPSVRQLTTCDLTLQGTEVTSQWTIAGMDATRQALTFSVDPAVRIIAAQIGDSGVPWSVSHDATGPALQVRIDLRRPQRNGSPTPLARTHLGAPSPSHESVPHDSTPIRPTDSLPFSAAAASPRPAHDRQRSFARHRFVVKLIGVAPLAANRRWRLPQIRCEGVAWESGQMRLLVAKPLVIRRLELSDCRQTRSEPIAAPGSGESLEIEAFSPTASFEIDVARPTARTTVRTGTTLSLGADEVTGRVVAEWTTTSEESHTFSAQVAAGWIVETVETDPGAMLANWSVDRTRDGTALLDVQLSKALAPRQPLRLIVNGRFRRSALDQRLPATALRVLQTTGSSSGQAPLMLIRAVDPFELQLTGDARLRFRNPAELADWEAALIEDPERGLLFDVDWNIRQLQVAVVRKTPRFAAEIDVEATVLGDSIEETYRFRCVPDASRLQRLLIGFTQAIDPPPRVTLSDPDHLDLAVRPIAVDRANQSDSKPTDQLWEVTLPKPFSTPFEFQAVHVRSWVEPVQVRLASVPDATVQRGRVAIRGASTRDIVIEQRRLEPIPLLSVPPDAYAPVHAMFRYEPARSALATTEPILTLRSGKPSQRQPQAWIWNAAIESRHAPSGRSVHRATYHIENRGRRSATWTMPPGTRLVAAWLDRVKLPLAGPTGGPHDLLVDLPLGQRFPELELELTCNGRPFGVVSQQRPAIPTCDLPIVASQWTLWLPPGFAVTSGETGMHATQPSTVERRLFGPLAPSAGWQPLAPLRRHDWARLLRRSQSLQTARQVARRALEQVAAASRPATSPQVATWGQVVAAAGRAAMPLGAPLLVDQTALARLGVSQTTPIPRTAGVRHAGASSLPRAAAILDQEGLALVIRPNSVLLTSAVAAAGIAPEQIAVSPTVRCGYLPVGDGRRAADAADAVGGSSCWTDAADWSTQQPTATVPWDRSSGGLSTATGWSATTWPIADRQDVQATVVAVWSRNLAALAIGGLVALAVCLPALRRPPASVALLAATSIAALLLPAGYALLATGGFLGALIGLACGTLRGATCTAETMAPEGDRSPSHRGPPPAATVGSALLVLLTGWAPAAEDASHSDPPVAAATVTDVPAVAKPHSPQQVDPPDRIHTVLIPTDLQGRRAGSKVYVSQDFLATLYRNAAIDARQPHDWVLTGATYTASVSAGGPPKRLAIDTLVASFDLCIFNRLTTVTLPFHSEDPAWVPGPAWLDGRPIEVTWPDDGSGMQVRIDAPGPCQLVIHMRPSRSGQPPPGGLRLTIPPSPSAQLKLTVPDRIENVGGLHLPVSGGVTQWDRKKGRVDIALGPVRRLTLGRPGGWGSTTSTAEIEATELLWLHVRPGAVILDVKHTVIPRFGQIDQIRLTADPSLRLLPQSADSPIESAEVKPGEPNRITLQLKRSTDQPLTITTRWLLMGYSGIGNLRLPHLSIAADQLRRRLLAVSVAPPLVAREDRRERLTALAISEFARAWGDLDAQPKFVYQLPNRGPLWSLVTWPRPARVTADQKLAMSLGRGEASVRYEAHLVAADGDRFQFRLAAPRRLIIDDLTVLQDDALRPVRWACDDTGNVTLFLSEPLTGEAVIALRGRFPIPVRGRFAVPKMKLEAAQIGSSELHVYQREAVLAEVTESEGLVVAEDVEAELEQRGLGRLVGAYTTAAPVATAALVVSPNRPRLNGQTVTTLRWTDSQWQADFDYFFQVTQGQVEQIRLDVPTWWNGPFRVDPPATVHTVEVPGRNRRRLVIRPQTAITGRCHMRLEAPLPSTNDQPLRVPHITTLNRGRVERFLVLPTRLERQQLVWTTRGLQPAELPLSLKLPRVSHQAPRVVRVVRDPFTAVPETVPEAATTPLVQLADVRVVSAGSERPGRGLVSFDLVPARLSSCFVHLPPNCQLMQASVQGYPAEARRLDRQRWLLPLRSATLAQRVEILFEACADGAWRQGQPWQAPQLWTSGSAIPVRRTLWTVAQSQLPVEGRRAVAGQADAGQLALARLETIDSILDLPREITDQVPLDQRARWYRGWARRLQFQLDAARQQPGQHDAAAIRRAETVAARQTAIAKRLGTTAVLAEIRQSPRVAREPSELFDALVATDVAAARFEFPAAQLTFEVPRGWRAARASLTARLAASAMIGVASVLTVLCLRSGRYRNVAWGPLHWVATVVGLAWWLWLRPSYVGWLLLAAVVLWTLYRGRSDAQTDLSE